MGRRIYENNNFVWKYTFGRQDSNMRDLTYKYGIGKYITEEYTEKDGEDLYNYKDSCWVVEKKDIDKLQKLLTTFSKKTRQQLNKIGMKAIIKFVEAQADDWKEQFKDDIIVVKKAKKEYDFPYNSSSGNGFTFDIYDIFAIEIEKHLSCSFDFYAMVGEFIKYMEKENRNNFSFQDETGW